MTESDTQAHASVAHAIPTIEPLLEDCIYTLSRYKYAHPKLRKYVPYRNQSTFLVQDADRQIIMVESATNNEGIPFWRAHVNDGRIVTKESLLNRAA